MALSRIEVGLGGSLFTRSHRRMVPTEAAERLVMRAKRVFAELRHLHAELLTEAGALAGTIVLGTPPMGRTSMFPLALAEALAAHPAIQVSLVETTYEQLLGGVRNGDVDAAVGVVRDRGEMRDLQGELLTVDRLAILARAGHPIAGRVLEPGVARDWRWILPRGRSPSRVMFEDCFRDRDLVPPRPSVESADLAVIRQLLLASDMLAVTSARQMMYELRSGLLIELDLGLPELTRDLHLITRASADLSRSAHVLLESLRRQVGL